MLQMRSYSLKDGSLTQKPSPSLERLSYSRWLRGHIMASDVVFPAKLVLSAPRGVDPKGSTPSISRDPGGGVLIALGSIELSWSACHWSLLYGASP